jgi:hypothetical protein
MAKNTQPSNHMNTSQQIRHVFGCAGPTRHLTPGFALLRSTDPTKCPQCGTTVEDVTDTLEGQQYLAFGRFDLGEKPA